MTPSGEINTPNDRMVLRGACDCHAHICGPTDRYDYAPDRTYTPPDALLPTYLDMIKGLGIERAVLVQPSIYGTDNQAMIDAILAAPVPCRGVVVLGPEPTREDIAAMHEIGIRGVRFNLVDMANRPRMIPQDQLRHCADMIAPFGWHIELQLHVDEFPNLDTLLDGFPTQIVFGHFGYPKQTVSVGASGFQALLRLLKKGNCWVKLSGAYRLPANVDTEAIFELARSFAIVAPDRLLWGSDWPHTNLPFPAPRDSALLAAFLDWVPDISVQQQILVNNPAQLYGF